MFAGGEPYYMPLRKKTASCPTSTLFPKTCAKRAKVLWLNYPNNPTAAVADLAFFEEAVRFAKKYDIAICHDGPYSEVAYDGYKPSASCRPRAPATSASSSTRCRRRST